MKKGQKIASKQAAFDFLSYCHRLCKVKNDRRLAQFLDIEPANLCRIRHLKSAVGDSVLLALHERAGADVSLLRMIVSGEWNGFDDLSGTATPIGGTGHSASTGIGPIYRSEPDRLGVVADSLPAAGEGLGHAEESCAQVGGE